MRRKHYIWNISYFARVLVSSCILLSAGGARGEDITEFRIFNGSLWPARIHILTPANDNVYFWIAESRESVIKMRPEVDFTGNITVQWNSEGAGNYWTNGNTCNGSFSFGDGVGRGIINAIVPEDGIFPMDPIIFDEGKPLSKAWWAGMGLGGGIGAVMVVLGALRLARQPLGGL